METVRPEQEIEVLTVSGLNRTIKRLLETGCGFLWVEGELSNFIHARSGHCYFSLKDASAQVRCALFGAARKLGKISLENGKQIRIYAKVTLYEPRGDYQLIVEKVEDIGLGDLHKKFEQTKKKLSQLGWFDAAYKKPIPNFPKAIGVVTSPTGAAIEDIISTCARRFPLVPILIYPTLVQGEQAIGKIKAALTQALNDKRVDVIIIGRGGGSLEDLWAFNDEGLAELIFKANTPIISAVGHEVDFSISDFVADTRAATPTAAAELVTPERKALIDSLQHLEQRLVTAMLQRLVTWRLLVKSVAAKIQHPLSKVHQQMQRLDGLYARLNYAAKQIIQTKKFQTSTLKQKLLNSSKDLQLSKQKHQVNSIQEQIFYLLKIKLQKLQTELHEKMASLEGVSPLATLRRGYAIATTAKHKPIMDTGVLEIGDTVSVQFSKGIIQAEVISISKDKQ